MQRSLSAAARTPLTLPSSAVQTLSVRLYGRVDDAESADVQVATPENVAGAGRPVLVDVVNRSCLSADVGILVNARCELREIDLRGPGAPTLSVHSDSDANDVGIRINALQPCAHIALVLDVDPEQLPQVVTVEFRSSRSSDARKVVITFLDDAIGATWNANPDVHLVGQKYMRMPHSAALTIPQQGHCTVFPQIPEHDSGRKILGADFSLEAQALF